MRVMTYLNPSFVLAKLRRRSFCDLAEGAVIHFEARIFNNQSSEAIKIGLGSQIRGELLTFGHGGQINIGKNCYVGAGSRIWSGALIQIDDYVLIAHNVSIIDNLTHPIDHLKRREHFSGIGSTGHPAHVDLNDKPIVIGKDAWIGANSVILRGVTIGERSIISAGSVLKEDIPADCIVAGNPAKIIRHLQA